MERADIWLTSCALQQQNAIVRSMKHEQGGRISWPRPPAATVHRRPTRSKDFPRSSRAQRNTRGSESLPQRPVSAMPKRRSGEITPTPDDLGRVDTLRIAAFGGVEGGASCGHGAKFLLPVELLLEMPGPPAAAPVGVPLEPPEGLSGHNIACPDSFRGLVTVPAPHPVRRPGWNKGGRPHRSRTTTG